jgi:hypothetical protein
MSEGHFDRLAAEVLRATGISAKRASRVLSGGITLANKAEPFLQFLDANGAARTVNLPLETANDGTMLMIVNVAAGAFALTLQSNAGAALSPAVSVAQSKAVLMACDGTAWRALVGA